MKPIKARLRERRYALLILLYPLVTLWYFLIQRFAPEPHAVYGALDAYVPFCAWFVLPYVAWYGFVFGALVRLIPHRGDFLRLLALLYGGMVVCLLIQTVYPNGITFRPETPPGDGLLTDMTAWIYANDRPMNVFPSIHCYNALAVALGLTRARGVSLRRGGGVLLWGTAGLICLSTVMIKQHSVWDIAGAAGVLLPLGWLIYRKSYKHKRSRNNVVFQQDAPGGDGGDL